MASQNVVSTWAGEGAKEGNAVGEGEGIDEAVDEGCGKEPPWDEAAADEGCDPSGPPMEAAFAPWKNRTPALSTRKSERHMSPVIRGDGAASGRRSGTATSLISRKGASLFLCKLHVPEDGPEGEVVAGFERPGQDERQPEHE
jgi:hypothetical protein